MEDVYVYNDFLELLELLIILLKNKIRPFNIKSNDYERNMFDNIIYLKLNSNFNNIKKFKNIFGSNNLKLIYYVFISNENNKELIIYYYLLNYFKFKDKLINMRNLKCVSEVLRINKMVGNENHRFKGFTRFKELNKGILYAEINPDNNILFLLSCHFKKRLNNEIWLIKDCNHNIISIYDKNDFYILNCDKLNFVNLKESQNENEYQELWQTFYDKIYIKERKNERCRMNFMPKKYWQYILEVKE